VENSNALSAALQVDVYPDETPQLSDAQCYEPEVHSETCTCGACERTFFDRLQAEDDAEHERLAAEYPLDPEDGPEDWGPAEGWPPSVEWDGWFATPVEPGPDWLPVSAPILPAACVCGACVTAQPAHEALADAVAAEARKHRRLDTPLHDMIADELLSLAHNIRRVQATSPIEYEARMEIIDRDVIAEAEERGYDAGYSAGLAATL
jgi:hypothetical protein